MLTDDDLTTLLRRGFAQSTSDLDPPPDLADVVRHRYVSARRRRVAVGVALPTAALAVGSGLALAGQGSPSHTGNHPAVTVPPPSASATTASTPTVTPRTSVPVKPASYRVVRINHGSAPPSCPANATGPVGKSANPSGAWFFTKTGTCVFVGVDWSDTKPAGATPVHMNRYPGLYATVENGVRAIYAPVAPGTNDFHPRGGWVVLTMSANAPQETAVRLIIVRAN